MVKLIYSICLSLMLVHCGTEVGNHQPVTPSNQANDPVDPSTGDVPEPTPGVSTNLEVLFAWCGSLFAESDIADFSLSSDTFSDLEGNFSAGKWAISYDAVDTATVTPNDPALYTVTAKNASDADFGDDVTCSSTKDLVGTGAVDEKVRFIQVTNNGVNYRVTWTLDETQSPQVLSEVSVETLSDGFKAIWTNP